MVPRSKEFNNLLIIIAILVVGIGVIVLFSGAAAQASSGRCALDFLNLPVGAYSSSMGQGNFAGIIGPEAIFRNPALLGPKTSGFASHQELLLDTRSEAAALTIKLNERYTLGIGLNVFDPGIIQGYSADDTKTGRIAAGDQLAKLAFCSRGVVTYGVSVSYYNQRLDDQVGNGFGLGAGIALETAFARFSVTADNIGPSFKIARSSAPLPQRYSLSAWLPLRGNTIDFCADMSYGRDRGILLSAGVEYRPVNGFFLRAGSNSTNPVSLGLRISARKLAFDYSYIPSSTFGDRHIFSLSLSN